MSSRDLRGSLGWEKRVTVKRPGKCGIKSDVSKQKSMKKRNLESQRGDERLDAPAVRPRQRQLLPTPQTSTASTASWSKEDFGYSSEIEEISVNTSASSISASLSSFKRPRMLRSVSAKLKNPLVSNSSWPFRSTSSADQDTTLSLEPESNNSTFRTRFKRVQSCSFPYARAVKKLAPSGSKLIFAPGLWTLLLKLSTVYAGDDLQGGDRQKRNEIAFAAWTTLVRVYCVCRIRGGESEIRKLAVAAVVLQSKLLEEADVDLGKLEKKLSVLIRVPKDKLEESERKIAKLLHWKLLTPSPQVILFTALDGLPLTLPMKVKLLASKVLDSLIEDFFLQDLLQHAPDEFDLVDVVCGVIGTVLDDFFSVFPRPNRPPGGLFPAVKLSKGFLGRIERAIETVVSVRENL